MRARVIASFLPCSMVDTCRVAPAECRSKSSSPRDKRYAVRRASSVESRRATPSRAEPRRATPSHAAARPSRRIRAVEPRRARIRVTPLCTLQRRTAVGKKTTRPKAERVGEPDLFRPYVPSIGNRSGIPSPGCRRDIEDAMSINIRRA